MSDDERNGTTGSILSIDKQQVLPFKFPHAFTSVAVPRRLDEDTTTELELFIPVHD